MSEIPKLRYLLFRCLCELSYVQSVENCNSGLCATAAGEWLIDEGIKLLGIPDLHEREEEKLYEALKAGSRQSYERWEAMTEQQAGARLTSFQVQDVVKKHGTALWWMNWAGVAEDLNALLAAPSTTKEPPR